MKKPNNTLARMQQESAEHFGRKAYNEGIVRDHRRDILYKLARAQWSRKTTRAVDAAWLRGWDQAKANDPTTLEAFFKRK